MEFVGWKEDWEKKLKKKNCTVVEAHFLLSTNLSFLFADNDKIYDIFKGIMEFHCGKTGDWIGECYEDGIEDEGFCQYLFVTLIRKYPQVTGVKMHQPPVGSLEEKQYEPD